MSLGSAELSICIYCRGSNGDFHDIFDEVGFELQLPKLIRQFFGITVKNTDGAEQQLCDDCVNRLIELVDLEEHNKEQELERANLNNDDPSNECGQNVVEPLEETTYNHNDDDNEEGTQSHSMPNDGSFESHENIELTTDGITAPQIHSTLENENYAEDHDAIVQQQEEFYDAALIENHPRNDQEYQLVLDKQSTEAEDDYSNDDTVQYEENIDNIAEIIEQQIEDDELLELDYGDVDVEEEEDIENGKEDASQEQYFGMEETEISESNYEVYEDQLKQRTIKENLMEEIEMGENSTMDNTSSYENIEDEEYLIEGNYIFHLYHSSHL